MGRFTNYNHLNSFYLKPLQEDSRSFDDNKQLIIDCLEALEENINNHRDKIKEENKKAEIISLLNELKIYITNKQLKLKVDRIIKKYSDIYSGIVETAIYEDIPTAIPVRQSLSANPAHTLRQIERRSQSAHLRNHPEYTPSAPSYEEIERDSQLHYIPSAPTLQQIQQAREQERKRIDVLHLRGGSNKNKKVKKLRTYNKKNKY